MRSTALLSALAALLSLPAGHAADEVPQLPQYVTKIYKGKVGAQLNDTLGPFYIPRGQCSGVLDSLLFCKEGEVSAVQVSVEERVQYSRVSIGDDLRQANVVRSKPCSAEAYVTLELACPDQP